MIIYYGTRMYGNVDQVGTASVRTRFFHISFLPIVPLGSYAVLDDGVGPANTFRGIPIGLHGRSILAGYLRVWGFVGAIAAAVSAYSAIPREPDLLGAVTLTLGLLVPFVLAALAIFWLGRLDTIERAQRWAYATFAGSPIDVALLGDGRKALCAQLHTLLVERGRSSVSGTYRTAMDPETQWLELALDPGTQDAQFVRAAFVRARIEWSLAVGAERSRYASAHRKLWARLTELDPTLLEDAVMTAPPSRGRVALVVVGALAVAGFAVGAWNERSEVQARRTAELSEMRAFEAAQAQDLVVPPRAGGIAVMDNVPLRAGDAIAYLATDGYHPGTVSSLGDGNVVQVRDDATGALVETTRDVLLYYPTP